MKQGEHTRRQYAGFSESSRAKVYNCQHQIDRDRGKPVPVEWCQYCSGDAINNPRCPHYEPIKIGSHNFRSMAKLD